MRPLGLTDVPQGHLLAASSFTCRPVQRDAILGVQPGSRAGDEAEARIAGLQKPRFCPPAAVRQARVMGADPWLATMGRHSVAARRWAQFFLDGMADSCVEDAERGDACGRLLQLDAAGVMALVTPQLQLFPCGLSFWRELNLALALLQAAAPRRSALATAMRLLLRLDGSPPPFCGLGLCLALVRQLDKMAAGPARSRCVQRLCSASTLPGAVLPEALGLLMALPEEHHDKLFRLWKKRLPGTLALEADSWRRIVGGMRMARPEGLACSWAVSCWFGPSHNHVQRCLSAALLRGLDRSAQQDLITALRHLTRVAAEWREALLLYLLGLHKAVRMGVAKHLFAVGQRCRLRRDGLREVLEFLVCHPEPAQAEKLLGVWSALCARFDVGDGEDSPRLVYLLQNLPDGVQVANRAMRLPFGRGHGRLPARDLCTVLQALAVRRPSGAPDDRFGVALSWLVRKVPGRLGELIRSCAPLEPSEVRRICCRLQRLAVELAYANAAADLLDVMMEIAPAAWSDFLNTADQLRQARQLGVGAQSISEVALAQHLSAGEQTTQLFALADAPGLSAHENVMNRARIQAAERTVQGLGERFGAVAVGRQQWAAVLAFVQTQKDTPWARQRRGHGTEYAHAVWMLRGTQARADRSCALRYENVVQLPGGLRLDLAEVLAVVWHAIEQWPAQRLSPASLAHLEQNNMRVGLCRALAQCVDEAVGGRVCATGVLQRLLRPLGGYYPEVIVEDVTPEDLVYALAAQLQQALGEAAPTAAHLASFRAACQQRAAELFAAAPYHLSKVPVLVRLAERCFATADCGDEPS